jgi:alpha-beta hydrolase superfamily lysophospholipase
VTSSLITTDGIELVARRSRPDAPCGDGVVVVHGFAGTKDAPELVDLCSRLSDRGLDVLSYDARGHGDSQGHCTLGHDEIRDVAAAVALLRLDVDRVFVVGASMGAIAILRCAAADPSISGVVVVSSPARWQVPRTWRGVAATALTQTSIGRRTARRLMNVRLAPTFERDASPEELAATIVAPLAVVHGRSDRFVSPHAARHLYDAADEPRRLMLVPDMGHAYDRAGFDAILEALDWCRSVSEPALS